MILKMFHYVYLDSEPDKRNMSVPFMPLVHLLCLHFVLIKLWLLLCYDTCSIYTSIIV